MIGFYDSINKYSTKVIAREYTSKNIDSCLPCLNLLTGYNPMNIQKKGYELLQNYSESNTTETDSLISNLCQFYSSFDAIITTNNDMIKSETLSNLNFYKKQNWFIPWMKGELTNEMRDFFGDSQDYKNRVAGNNILATNNHQAYIKVYKQNAIELLKQINVRLKED